MFEGSETERRPKADGRSGLGCLPSMLVGLGCGLVVAMLLVNAWNDCGAALPGFNTVGAVFDGAVTMTLTGVAFWFAGKRIRIGSARTNVAASGVIAALVAYYLFMFLLPGSFRGAFFPNDGVGTCPGNVPPWWPTWLPI